MYNSLCVNPYQVKVREEVITSSKIDSNLNNTYVMYFSDLYYGSSTSDNTLKTIKKKVNNLNPDIIIFGGNLIYDESLDTSSLRTFLSELNPSHGKYAVLGESDSDLAIDVLNSSGFKILNDETASLYINGSYLNIVGLTPELNEHEGIFNDLNLEYFTFVVSSYGDNANKIDTSNFDYFLAGNSLGGLVYVPLINHLYRPTGSNTYYHGKSTNNNLTIDVSNGVGTKDKKIRFAADSEIVIYRLTNS